MKIKPALTEEQWTRVLSGETFTEIYDPTNIEEPGSVRHRDGAIAFYGQPFGFTHEDVEGLRVVREEGEWLDAFLVSLMDRIEAALPPKTLQL